jgi:hypothetical protein
MSYGATLDYFNLANANWRLQSSSKSPVKSNSNAQDSNGDNVCETVHDTSATFSCEYASCGVGDTGGNVVFPTLVAGTIDTENSSIITGFAIATSNTARPKLTVTGEKYYGDTSGTATYSPTLPTIKAGKKATAMGFTPDTNSRVTSSTWNFATQASTVLDSNGQRVVVDISQGRIDASGELVSCTAIAAATAAAGYTLDGPNGSSTQNTGYGSSTVAVFKNVIKDS